MIESVFDTAYFEKIKNDIRNESKNIRKNCLDELHDVLHSTHCEFDSVDKTDIFKTIIKVFDDKTEACRERAVKLATNFVDEWDLPQDVIMFYLLPTIYKRLVSGAEPDPAEEVRLCLVKLLKAVVDKYGTAVGPHLADIVNILIQCLCDEYPEVKKEACECASDLAETVPEFRLHSENIISAVLKVVRHKHSRIRISAITALRNIVQFGHPGAVEMAYGVLGECLVEQNSQVRSAVLRVAAFWFSKLRDRYSYFRYLLPLILIEQTDDSKENREEAQILWHEIGLQYLRENSENLKEKEELLPKELENYPTDVKRPNLGCRTIVQNEMMRIIPTLLHELEDWKSEVRIKSSELLKNITLHGENRIVSSLDIALPVMCRACMDAEILVRKNVVESAEIMGYFVPVDMYWNLLIPKMKENHSPGQYVILSALLKFNPCSNVAEKITEIITDLSDCGIRGTREERCQHCLLQIVSKSLVCVSGLNLSDETIYEFYLILISLLAFGNDEVRSETTGLVEKLASTSSNACVSDLHAVCLPKLFISLVASSSVWESYSSDYNIFLALLTEYAVEVMIHKDAFIRKIKSLKAITWKKYFRDDVFRYVSSELLNLMKVVFDPKAEREVTFRLLQRIGKLLENDKFDFNNNAYILEKMILGPMKTQLIWKAGRVLEVIRCTAVGIVLLFVQKSSALTRVFVENIHPLVLSLCEDAYDETRIYSLQILPFLGRDEDGTIETEIFVKSFNVAAERLNDKSNLVRLKAATSLKNLLIVAPRLDIYDNDMKVTVVKGLWMMLLNADDEDKKIRAAILDIIKHESIVTNMKSILLKRDINDFMRKCRNPDLSDLLKNYLNI